MKKFKPIALCLAFLFMLAGCGTASTDNISGSMNEDPSFSIIELKPDMEYTVDSDYTISALNSDILSDISVNQGWYYYFSKGTEPGNVPWEKWTCADGMYTSCELLFDMKNLKENMDKTFIERFNGLIVYNADLKDASEYSSAEEYFNAINDIVSENTDAETFPLTPLQRNPGQFDTDGYETRSIDAALLARDETAQQDLIADVSEAFLRSWENSSSQEPMWAVFSYNDDVIFTVDLRKYMKECSR